MLLLYGDTQIAGSIVKIVTQIMFTTVSHTNFYIKYELCTSALYIASLFTSLLTLLYTINVKRLSARAHEGEIFFIITIQKNIFLKF